MDVQDLDAALLVRQTWRSDGEAAKRRRGKDRHGCGKAGMEGETEIERSEEVKSNIIKHRNAGIFFYL